MLVLVTAYTWLRGCLPEIFDKVTNFIAKDQEEPLPLDWAVLVEDWDHTYLLVWIYIILSQHSSHPTFFPAHHLKFYDKWLKHVIEYAVADALYAPASEIETINVTIEFVAELFGQGEEERIDLRNKASYIVKMESVAGLLIDDGDEYNGAQEMLCVPGI